MISLDILAVGSLIRDGDTIKEAHSTSTLIRTEEMNIVVDTSSDHLRPAIRTSLRQLKILQKDVDVIVLTHAHHDHTSNNDLFPKAKVYIRAEEDLPGAVLVNKDMKLCDGVRLVHTPGHTNGSMSVFVEGERRYSAAGDAIPLEDNFRMMVPPRLHSDRDAAMKSIKMLGDYSDVIIPGHGFPFLK